jgi:hypothetical protein
MWLENAGPSPWYTWTLLGAGVTGVLALIGTIYNVKTTQGTQQGLSQQRQDFEKELGKQRQDFEKGLSQQRQNFDRELSQQQQTFQREMKDLENKYEEEQANKAAIRKVLKACTRGAVMTPMHAQVHYEEMFKGIRECRVSLQQDKAEIRVENQQHIVGDNIEELRSIQAHEENFHENYEENSKEINRAKLSILRRIMELSNNAGVPYTLPRNLTEAEEMFSGAEGADEPQEP